MTKFFEFVLPSIMQLIQYLVSEENIKWLADKLLDLIEEMVEKTDNEFDDKIVLPIINQLRSAFDIPDND